MAKNTSADLWYGTLIFILLGTLATGFGIVYFRNSTSGTREERLENAKYVFRMSILRVVLTQVPPKCFSHAHASTSPHIVQIGSTVGTSCDCLPLDHARELLVTSVASTDPTRVR